MPLLERDFPFEVATVVGDLPNVSDGNVGIVLNPLTIYGRSGGQWNMFLVSKGERCRQRRVLI
jgi:hypothetical protein